MDFAEIIGWLRETDPNRLEELWARADRVREENVGPEVHLRGLVEISNYCTSNCGYCGIRCGNPGIRRYRMAADEILDCAKKAVTWGLGTLVFQSGEDPGLTTGFISSLIRSVKEETGLAMTLSLGVRPLEDLVAWKKEGGDRYLLRFETSDPALFEKIHPPRCAGLGERLKMLRQLRELGFETGSGVMVGIPGQTFESLARDLLLFRELGLHMVGVGPWLPHPETPLGQEFPVVPDDREQVPNDALSTYKVVALTRLLLPLANIPSTTALTALKGEDGRELGLRRGANVVMPNLTPLKYRAAYEIYPAKARVPDNAERIHEELKRRILSIGRVPGQGRGDSREYHRHRQEPTEVR